MTLTARWEMRVLILLVVVFVVLLIPALLHARREARDEIRRSEVAAFKRVLEQYYNVNNTYPPHFDASPHRYVVTEHDDKGATRWYVQAQLENQHETASGFDAEAGRNYYWRLRKLDGATLYEVCGGGAGCSLESE